MPVTEFKITDIPTTATTPATDDFVELGGSTNGSRKIAAQKLGANVFQTIAALKAADASAGTTTVEVLGYYAAGDGGGGQFFYDPVGVAADNLGTILVPNAGVGNWIRQFSGRLNVKWFGATGDGATNDRDSIRAAIAVCKSSGSGLEANAEDTYFVGTFPNTTGEKKFTVDFDGFVFEPNNCEFTATTNTDASLFSTTLQTLFYVVDASNVRIGDFRCTANANDRTLTSHGVVAVLLFNSAANSRNLSLGTLTGTKLLSCVTVASTTPATFRFRGIRFDRLQNDGGVYNLNCVENGDDLSGTIYANDGVRAYFVYGVTGHNVKVYSTNHLKFTDILIKRYSRDTESIVLDYSCPSDLSSDATISIEHQNDSDDGAIRNVDVTFNVTKSNAANPTLNFVSFTAAGATRATTASVTDDVRVRGKSNSTTTVVIGSTLTGTNGKNRSRLYAPRAVLSGLFDFKRFIVHLEENQIFARADLSGAGSLRFNLSEYSARPLWLNLTVLGSDKPGSSYTDFVLRTYLLSVQLNNSGDLVIGSSVQTGTLAAGALFTALTFPAQTGTFNFVVDIATFTDASRHYVGTIEVLTNQ